LQPHGFQLLLNLALLLIQLVLSLFLLLELSFQLLLAKRLLITSALTEGGARHLSTRIRRLAVQRLVENAETEKEASSFHHGAALIRNAHRDPRPISFRLAGPDPNRPPRNIFAYTWPLPLGQASPLVLHGNNA
jgi:hypothetical protein